MLPARFRALYPLPVVRVLIQGVIALGFVTGCISMLLRRRKVLGLTGSVLSLLAALLGGGGVALPDSLEARPTLGLDWFNIGTGTGHTVAEVVAAVERVTGRPVRTVRRERRPGDPATLVASADRIRRVLGWTPRYPDLEEIIATAWRWRQQHPGGYGD